VTVASTRVEHDPILEVPVENNVNGKLLNRGDEDEVLIAIAILLKLHIVGEEGVDEALVLVLKTAQELLPLLKTLLAVGYYAINLSKDTVDVFRGDRATSTVFTVLSLTNALSHFMRPVKNFFTFVQVLKKRKSRGRVPLKYLYGLLGHKSNRKLKPYLEDIVYNKQGNFSNS
jgi:hypothetical protein